MCLQSSSLQHGVCFMKFVDSLVGQWFHSTALLVWTKIDLGHLPGYC